MILIIRIIQWSRRNMKGSKSGKIKVMMGRRREYKFEWNQSIAISIEREYDTVQNNNPNTHPYGMT